MTQETKPQLADNQQERIHLSLNAPEMTAMHQMGIAGLWMTLRQLENRYPTPSQRSGNITWVLSRQSISISWQGCDYTVIDWLLRQAFQVDEQGLISLTGLNQRSMSFQAKLVTHHCILNTFLQHNKFCKQGKKHVENVLLGKRSLSFRYSEVISYAHQSFAAHICDESGNLVTEHVPIAGWLYPGAVVRHARFGEKTKFEESSELAFALLFAPIACRFYFLLPTLIQKTLQFALVIPHIVDLELFAQYCWSDSDSESESFCALSAEEAGLKSLAALALLSPLEEGEIRRCNVTTFGTVDWSKQQKTRLAVVTVEATKTTLQEYQLSCNCFRKSEQSEKQTDLTSPSYAHAIVVSNLSRGLAWWDGLFEKTKTLDTFRLVSRERQELSKMLENTQFENSSYVFFIKACHEAFKKTYAKIYGRASEGQHVDIERKNIRIRSELNRCKDNKSFRYFLSDFFAKAGTNSVLEERWEELLPLLTGTTDWRVTRDLFLLSMASYPSIEGAEKRRTQQEKSVSNSD